MPRVIKPRVGWQPGGLITPAKLTRAQVCALAEAAGLDPRAAEDQTKCKALARDVGVAIGAYRSEREGQVTGPRPVHQRAALDRVEDAIDGLIAALNDLDGLSAEQLGQPRRNRAGMDISDALDQLRFWSGTVTLTLRALEGAESRGKLPDLPKRILLSLLADAFDAVADAADGSDLAEFLQVGCRCAGVQLVPAHAQTVAPQLLRKTTP